jgi:peroxiredoxin
MALTESTMLELGTEIPEFSLPDVVSGKSVSLKNFKDKEALLVMFICQHCPYVRFIQDELAQLGEDYKDRSLGIVAISSNDTERFPDDSPERLKEMAEDLKLNFPLCIDETQEVAKSFSAACTPEFYLFDKRRDLVYRGQLDDSRPDNGIPTDGKDLREAIDNLLAGRPVESRQKPSTGCNIKWKPGNEPKYHI